MAYADKDKGKLTGLWLGEVQRGGKRYRKHFDTKKEAEAYEGYVRMMGEEPPTILEGRKVALKGRSFAEVAEQCKEAGGPNGAWKVGRDPSLLQRLDYVIGKIGAYDIEDITRTLVREKVADALARTPVKPGKLLKQSTVNRYVSVASGVLSWACDEGLLAVKPELQFKNESKTRAERDALPFELEDRIVNRLEQNGLHVHAVIVRVLAESGLRLGEVYKLAPEQIEPDAVFLKGSQTKNNRPRQVHIEPALLRQLKEIITSRQLPDRTLLLRRFQAAAISEGSKTKPCLHELRHSRRTRLRKAGVAEEVIMKILGHTSVSVSRGYDHIDLEDQRAAAKRVGDLRGDFGGQVVQLKQHTGS